MAEHSHIEWTDATWNPITGCSVVSPGCTNCYAMKLAGTRLKHIPSRVGLTIDTKAGPVWNGQVRLNEQWLDQPFRWIRPRRIFVCAHGDLFHESVPDAWIDQVFARMAISYHHQYQVLTKRSARMRAYLSDPATATRIWALAMKIVMTIGRWDGRDGWPLENVWLGVSAEDQPRFDDRVADLRNTPASIRFVSFEPLLGPINAKAGLMGFGLGGPANCVCGHGHGFGRCPNYGGVSPGCHKCGCTTFTRAPDAGGIHWAIVGGENGPRAMHPDWARQLRDDCAATGTAFFFKQWGSYAEFEVGSDEAEAILADVRRPVWVHVDGRTWRNPDDLPEGVPARLMMRVGKKAAGRLLDGVLHDALPAAR